jgi:ABC-type bacteriocin/lantibiotic exporter with double-glycine peptidase domain
LRIAGYKQVQSYTCGFIASANVLLYFNPKADLGFLYSKLDDKDGTHVSEVAGALKAYGVSVRKRTTLDFSTLCQVVKQGSLVICSITTTFYDHWIVLYGCDKERQTVFVCGNGLLPILNRKEVAFDRFCEKWMPKGNGLVCSKRATLAPRLNKKAPIVRMPGRAFKKH